MTTLDESPIYRDLIRFRPAGLSPNAWAVKAGVSRTVWTDMRRHGNPSRRTLEKLLAAVDSSLAEFEALRLGPEPRQTPHVKQLADRSWSWSHAPLEPLPLLASFLAGEWREAGSTVDLLEIRSDQLLDRLPRPVSLAHDPDAFALTIVGTSMSPRFRPGTRVAISPRSAVAVGDDVLVRLRAPLEAGAEHALAMQLIRRAAQIFELQQFNPDLKVQIEADEVETVFKIVGELI